eukprot:m.270782 g.270782  ORF g.270782 m.270782 type:complete len:421 (+) comp40544_c2_seq15:35-1297(+)
MAAEPGGGGHDEAFVEPLDKDLECPICLSAMKDPMLTICGHQFCESCLFQQPARHGKIVCSECRKKLDEESDVFPDNKLDRKILSLKVKCRLHKEKCRWTGELRSIEDHLNDCGYVRVECTNECEQMIKRREMAKHLDDQCPKRRVHCMHCRKGMPWNRTREHESNCPKKLIGCHFCMEMIQREKMKEHTSTICSRVTIKCSYADIDGCEFQCERRLMEKHMKSAVTDHTTKLLEKVKSQNDEITNMKKSLLALETYVSLREKPGTFLWALKDTQGEQISATYYTRCHGYNIRFECRDVSDEFKVSVRSLRGDYDDDIDWPADFKCVATVIDQKTDQSTTAYDIEVTETFAFEKMGSFVEVFHFEPRRCHVKNGFMLLQIRVTKRNDDHSDSDDDGDGDDHSRTSDDQDSGHSNDSDVSV